MIDCLIFSKDRTAQLDLLLRSIKSNFSELKNITVLYKFSNSVYRNGYIKLQKRFPNINWVLEMNFKKDLLEIINSFQNKYSLILVDDEVIVNDFKIETSLPILSRDDVHCISLRMHPNITYTYTADVPNEFKGGFEYVDDLNLWKWKKCNPVSDSGYPSCINSHVYRTTDLKHWCSLIDFSNPNSLEGQLNTKRNMFKDYMVCFNIPKTVNIANNLVQTGDNRHSNLTSNTVEFLNDKYIKNHIISLEPFTSIEKNTPTFEFDYIWCKYDD